jgi:hypothetical protein
MKSNDAFVAQLIQTLTATYGGKVTLRKRRGKTEVIARADMSKRKLSEKQIEVNDTMAAACAYAKSHLANEKYKEEAQVRLNVSSNRLYHALVREFFKNEREENEKSAKKLSTDNKIE